MKGVNKVILLGVLGADPDVRYTTNGSAVATISIATSEYWRDKETNEKKEKTQWTRAVFFGKLADIVKQFLKKGSRVYVAGKLQTRKYKDKSGADRYVTEVVCDDMIMLSGKDEQQQKKPLYKDGIKGSSEQQQDLAIEDDDFNDNLPF